MSTGGAAIPEHAAEPTSCQPIKVKHRTIPGISRRWRLSIAKAIGDGAWINSTTSVDQHIRTSEGNFRAVTGCAGLGAGGRKVRVKEYRLPKCFDPGKFRLWVLG